MDKRYGEFTEEGVEIALKHMTTCLNWLLIKAMLVKTSLSCLFSQIRLRKTLMPNRSEYCLHGSEEICSHRLLEGKQKRTVPMEGNLTISTIL